MSYSQNFSVWWSKSKDSKMDAVLKIVEDRTGHHFESYQKFYFFMIRMRRDSR